MQTDITIDIHNYPANVTRQDIMDMLREMDRKEAEVREQMEERQNINIGRAKGKWKNAQHYLNRP